MLKKYLKKYLLPTVAIILCVSCLYRSHKWAYDQGRTNLAEQMVQPVSRDRSDVKLCELYSILLIYEYHFHKKNSKAEVAEIEAKATFDSVPNYKVAMEHNGRTDLLPEVDKLAERYRRVAESKK